MVRIDGSAGEGGGQVLRTSLSLSLVAGQPFRIGKIRASRRKPRLLRQHLTAVQAAAEVSGSRVEGAALGSAGSGTLVFQTVFPALMPASAHSTVTIEGGTHNQAAPPFDFLSRVFLPLIARMGPAVTLPIERYGFYPAGGGRFHTRLAQLAIGERGAIVSRRATAIVANPPATSPNRK